MIGKVGRLTGAVHPGGIGEAIIPVRGGTETFYAYASKPSETIPKGARVIVLDYEPPRNVIVALYDY